MAGAGSVVRSPFPNTGEIFCYFSALTLLVNLVAPDGKLLDIATAFVLKNQLGASAAQVSFFRLVTAAPVYICFAFGLARDRWNPLGCRDRGFLLLFAPAAAAVFVWMALSLPSFQLLLVGMVLAMVLFQFIGAAAQALLALLGQERLMTGRLSALWSIVVAVPSAAGAFAGGFVAERLSPRQTFLVVVALTLLISWLGLWKPASVFGHAYDQPQAKGVADLRGDVKRLVNHRAIYPPALMIALWQFSPGWNTPLQYYLTGQLHATDDVYGYFNGIFQIGLIPAFLLYGFLCRRIALNKLLWWGVVMNVPSMIPLGLIHSGAAALWWAIPIGLTEGFSYVALYDLVMRSCPPGLQGTMMMLVYSVSAISFRGSDPVGVLLYTSSAAHGFLYCVIGATAVYALILAVIPFVPKILTATADGQPQLEADVRGAITGAGSAA